MEGILGFSPGNKRFRQRARLGIRYVRKYLTDELLNTYHFNYSPTKPLDVLCEITYNCNLRCVTCFRWTSLPNKDELRLSDWKDVIVNLKKWLGIFNLSFSGGEPFLREDLPDICRFASENGIVVSVVSNGSLIDKTLAKKIVSSGLDALSLSLNSLNPEIHNTTRGTNSSFNEVMAAIENLRERGNMRLTISTTVMRENVDDLINLVEFVKSEGLDGINFQPLMEASIFPIFDRAGQTKKIPEGMFYRKFEKDMENINSVFEHLISMKRNGYPINNSQKHLMYTSKYLQNPVNPDLLNIPCKIGPKNLFIDPFGNIRICMVMDIIGNITQSALKDIWNSDKAKRQRKKIQQCQKTCKLLNCNFKELDLVYKIKHYLDGCF